MRDHLGTAAHGLDADADQREYRQLLEEVTLDHLISVVPLGLHLSGGVDSALLAAIAARSGHQVPTFTVVERTTWRAGDVAAARDVTRSLGLPWHPVLYDYHDIADVIGFDLTRFEQLVWMMDSPRFDPEWLLKEELHRYTRTAIPGLDRTSSYQSIEARVPFLDHRLRSEERRVGKEC